MTGLKLLDREHTELIERWKAGDRSEDLIRRFWEVKQEIMLRCFTSYGPEASAVICEILEAYLALVTKQSSG